MEEAVRRYCEIISWFTQETKIDEKYKKCLDSNKIEIEKESVQFPNYMGNNVNFLI